MKILMTLLVLAGVAVLWLARDNRDLTQSLTDATQTVSQQKKDLQTASATLTAMQANARRNEGAQVLLRQQRDAAEALATRRHQTITRLLHENDALRQWYHSPLPDDIVRLHRRPAFATPDDYLRWLSEGQQLPDTGKPTDHQRGTE
ncbi:hypothetical protein IV04_13320 [Serratia sp. Ag1]|nr:hypothetical protein JV45_16845 [Serratia sp. Ag2]KFK98369.1 hypothetical protein IV04_13320 [Serratia sp. Ag1]